jgi:photoactive yellow protein
MNPHVLVIEDNADLAELFELTLLGENYEVETTPSGLTGLVRFAEVAFDIVLLDMQIEDLSGPGAHRAIKDLSPRAAVVCMSAQTSGWRQDALSHGATACLPKPFPPAALVGLLTTITRSEHPSPAFPFGDVRALEPRDLERLAALSPVELDALPLGAIRLNREGLITAYNAYEAEVALRLTSAVLGMPFSMLAPCTMVKEFLSAMEEGFREHHMDRVLRFAFPYYRASRVVSVRLYYDRSFEQMWLFISTARGQASPLALLPPRRRPC